MKKQPALLKFAFLTFVFAPLLYSAAYSNMNVIFQKVSADATVTSVSGADTLDNIVGYLLDASAKDFYDNQRPAPVDFRNVQLKLFEEKHYLICGEFLVQDENKKENWIEFTTIKTSGYEQWLGITNYCQKSVALNYKTSDLSSALKSRIDSLRTSGK